MIRVDDVLKDLPHFDGFVSVEGLRELAERLNSDPKFRVSQIGTSANGVPIHHVRYGAGSVKAMVVAFPHPNEPIGGLTVYGLLRLLEKGNEALLAADVEWHFIPCIDPDGAILNEGWSQKPFDLRLYMRNFHRQMPRDQIEANFPLRYKNAHFEPHLKEAALLQQVMEEVLPDFFFSLHNTHAGGAYFCVTRDLGDPKYYRQLKEIIVNHDILLQKVPYLGEWCSKFAEGVREPFPTKRFYDFLEKTSDAPQDLLDFGQCSWDHMTDIKPSSLSFLCELPFVRHPMDGSPKLTGLNHREFKLRIDAANKYVITAILEEWEKAEPHLDRTSPFYKKINHGAIIHRERLPEGIPMFPYKTRDILFNPAYGKEMTEGELFDVCLMERFFVLCNTYEFVRLLEASGDVPVVREAIDRLEGIYAAALDDLADHVDFGAFEPIDCDSLAEIQIGSGLIALNAVLEQRGGASAAARGDAIPTTAANR